MTMASSPARAMPWTSISRIIQSSCSASITAAGWPSSRLIVQGRDRLSVGREQPLLADFGWPGADAKVLELQAKGDVVVRYPPQMRGVKLQPIVAIELRALDLHLSPELWDKHAER